MWRLYEQHLSKQINETLHVFKNILTINSLQISVISFLYYRYKQCNENYRKIKNTLNNTNASLEIKMVTSVNIYDDKYGYKVGS